MRTIILTIGKAAKRLIADPDVIEPLAGAVRKATAGASEVSFIKIVINIVRPSGH